MFASVILLSRILTEIKSFHHNNFSYSVHNNTLNFYLKIFALKMMKITPVLIIKQLMNPNL